MASSASFKKGPPQKHGKPGFTYVVWQSPHVWVQTRTDRSQRKPASFVDIFIGTEPARQKFTVHKDLCCYHSPFFNAAFTGSFLEGETQSMTLEDVHPIVFGLLVYWIYTETVAIHKTGEKQWKLLVDLWLLAQRCLIPKLQNDVMIKLYTRVNVIDNSQLVKLCICVYQRHETEDTPLRALVVHELAWYGNWEGANGMRRWRKELEGESALLFDAVMVFKGYEIECGLGPKKPSASNFFVKVTDTEGDKMD